MALPSVNENITQSDRPEKQSADRINRSAQGYFNITKKYVAKNESKNTTLLFESKSSNESLLEKIYLFFVNDTNQKRIDDELEYKNNEEYEKKIGDNELQLVNGFNSLLKEDKKQESKSIISRLMDYYKAFSAGKFVYNQWENISKLLGLEKLTESIKGLSEQLGLNKLIDNIKSTVDDILKSFSFSEDVPKITGKGPIQPSKYDDLFQKIGKEEGVDPALLKSIAKAESGFRPEVTSPKGAKGLMQLMPATAKRFGVEPGKEYEPETNIRGGAKYLKFLSGKYKGDTTRVIAAYNAGEGNVDRYGGTSGIPPFKETREYVKKVTGFLSETPSVPETPTPDTTAIRVPKKIETQSQPKVSGDNPLDLANKFLRKDEKTDSGELNSFINKNFGSFDVTKTPWCAAFVNSVLNASGYRGTGNASAKSFLAMPGIVYDRLTGQGNVHDAKPGDIAVFQRTGGGHVGFVQSVDMNGINIVGGNQSDKDSGGQVSVSRRSFDDLLGIRRPGSYKEPVMLSQGVPTEKPTTESNKGMMDIMMQSYQDNMKMMSTMFSPDSMKRFEGMLESITKDIPKKDMAQPDVGGILQQNNVVVNVTQNKKNQPGVNPNSKKDVPALFATNM